MTNDKELIEQELNNATRQYCHNNGDIGYVIAYDKKIVDALVGYLSQCLQDMQRRCEESEKERERLSGFEIDSDYWDNLKNNYEDSNDKLARLLKSFDYFVLGINAALPELVKQSAELQIHRKEIVSETAKSFSDILSNMNVYRLPNEHIWDTAMRVIGVYKKSLPEPPEETYTCEDCRDTGRIPLEGNSGSEADGYAPNFEDCHCRTPEE